MKNWKELESLIKGGQTVEISGVPNLSAQAFIISKVVPFLKERPIFWLAKDETEANLIKKSFKVFKNYFKIKNSCFLISPSQVLPYLGKINHEQSLFFAPLEVFEKTLPSKEEFIKNSLALKKSQSLTPQELTKILVKLGYEYDIKIQTPGFYSFKGGIINIFPFLEPNPFRIEFSEKDISNIYTFDIKTQKIKSKIKTFKLLPLELKEKVFSGKLIDYLDEAYFIYSDYEEFEEIFPNWEQLFKKIKKFQSLAFETLGNNNQTFSLPLETPNFYHGRLENLIADLKKWTSDWKIIIFSAKISELKKYFKSKIPQKRLEYILADQEENFGFLDKANKTAFLTDLEIYGHHYLKESGVKNKPDPLTISELKVGDYVVHLDHGIAQFSGMVREKISGVEKEYFALNYAEGDKLLVPVETAEKISKYFGSPHPRLHRLSGGNWYQITRKIKEEALKTARQLLQLFARREAAHGKALNQKNIEETELAETFEYEETPDQLRTMAEIKNDLEKEKPMDRLVCGDVGFGKTELAIRAAFKAVMNRKQVAVLSPTTILTQQHYDTFQRRLKNFPVNIDILSRFRSEKEQKDTLNKLDRGEVDIVIGTHRLLSSDVKFKDLGLIIIDEEQRFGVKDKEKLKDLRTEAHILTLTATPIPRTLHLSLSELKDISTIETPPPGRLAIKTYIEPYDQEKVKKAIQNEIARRGQAYFLHNEVETIEAKMEELKKIFGNKKKPIFGLIHGQLPEKEIAETMSRFDNKKIDILVATTIIENGLDLPNVNTLIVNGASDFGLAQLYQLRGRIGRGTRQAYAYFLYTEKKLSREAKKRFLALREAYALGSGLKIALRDLEIRGVGNILGQEQHGNISAIGLNLYLRLLNQAVEELKTGVPQKPIRDVAIDLPLPAYIPKDFIPLETVRLKLYQELANINHLKELENFKKKISNNRKLPESFSNLFEVLEIKILSQKTNISSFNTASVINLEGEKKKRIVIKFVSWPSSDILTRLLKSNSAWIIAKDQVKIDLENLGEKWLNELKKAIRVLEVR